MNGDGGKVNSDDAFLLTPSPLLMILHDRPSCAKYVVPLSRFVNMGLACLMAFSAVNGILKIAQLQLDTFFVALYMFIFAAILFFFELCQFKYVAFIDNVFRRNFGFMYGSRGKALYIIFKPQVLVQEHHCLFEFRPRQHRHPSIRNWHCTGRRWGPHAFRDFQVSYFIFRERAGTSLSRSIASSCRGDQGAGLGMYALRWMKRGSNANDGIELFASMRYNMKHYLKVWETDGRLQTKSKMGCGRHPTTNTRFSSNRDILPKIPLIAPFLEK
ncbi:Golgi apparatus membrane protein TVP15 [Nannochloropsis gaditana]|uniref:Golgi apparatus membrane protein TVP15 n=1 Tax=Nannochloropsis gaditana TaxID=72520 RepID=W7TXL3_9STRA|nr:Golgi apparatus membrane protein TVP15 [Nannochloropsis gaditana]